MRLHVLLIGVLAALTIGGCGSSSATPSAATPTATKPAATSTSTAQPTGSITGKLGYPASEIQPLRVYAINVTNSSINFHVDTAKNQPTYTISGVTPGTYHVIAYLIPDIPALRGGYSQFVLCGMTVSCKDHTLVDVVVTPGGTTPNIDPIDWYAVEGTFPAPPK